MDPLLVATWAQELDPQSLQPSREILDDTISSLDPLAEIDPDDRKDQETVESGSAEYMQLLRTQVIPQSLNYVPFGPESFSQDAPPLSKFLRAVHSGNEEQSMYMSDADMTYDSRRSLGSRSTYYTARSQLSSARSQLGFSRSQLSSALSQLGSARSHLGSKRLRQIPGQLRDFDDYARIPQSAALWLVPFDFEQNWSGRGQHVEFKKGDEPLINELLQVQVTLGHTRAAFVQSVKCRRILLARKTIACGKNTMSREDAIQEVAHLTRLNHAHIIRVIGTYVKGRELSILLYPVAKYNLDEFIDVFKYLPNDDSPLWLKMYHSGSQFYACLSSAVEHIHNNLTKHMVIKPQNILTEDSRSKYKPYIADFGISRRYERLEDIETDGQTSFTRKYAAPEVVRQDTRGLPADIFSLGCVLLEIWVTLESFMHDDEMAIHLRHTLEANTIGDQSYQANIAGLQQFLEAQSQDILFPSSDILVIHVVKSMLVAEPQDRPTANEISKRFQEQTGIRKRRTAGRVDLQAMEETLEE